MASHGAGRALPLLLHELAAPARFLSPASETPWQPKPSSCALAAQVKLLEGWQDARPSCAYQTAQAPLRDALLCAGLFDLNARCKQFAAGQPQARPAGLAP
jgi:hypothetical protein